MLPGVLIVEQAMADLEAYASVSIGFEVIETLDVDELLRSRRIVVHPTGPWWKDYDLCAEDHPAALPNRFDTTNWRVLAAFEGNQRLGGAILARATPGLDMLQGRTDLAIIMDIRVAKDARGQGIGKALFNAASDWARSHGCTELIVETQDTNVPACRFYQAMGCRIQSIDPAGYGPEIPEAKLIWRIDLAG